MSDTRLAAIEPLERRAYYASVVDGKADVAVTVISRESIESLPVGTRSLADLTLKNVGTAKAQGKATLAVYASADDKLDSNDRLLISAIRDINILPGKTSTQRVNFTYPTTLTPRSYRLIGSITPQFPDANKSNNTRISSTRINLTPLSSGGIPDYSLTFGSLPTNFPFGVPNTVPATLRNTGKGDSTAPIKINLYSSTDKIFGNGDDRLLTSLSYNSKLKAGASAKLNLTFTTPFNFVPGDYYIAAKADANSTVKEANESNNVIFSNLRIHF